MNHELLQTVLSCRNLPSIPAVAVRVIELTQDPDVKLTEIAATIQNDQALASKILRTVNSSFYGLRKGCSTISHALVLLGLNPVKTLALGFSLVSSVKKGLEDPFDHISYWRRQLFTAVAAKNLASASRYEEPEEAFLVGLLQDIGMAALYSALGEKYLAVMEKAGGDHRKLALAEREELELTHAEVGAELCKHWKLPATLTLPIRYHEQASRAQQEGAELIRFVYVGNLISETLTSDTPANPLEEVYDRCESWMSFSRDHVEDILSRTAESAGQLGRLFEIDTGGYVDVDQILDSANQALIKITLDVSQEATQLSQQNQKLKEQVETDALTGAANRARFNKEIAEAFKETQAGGKLAVIFIDADHFKSVNDTYGHLAGDAVLVELSRRLIDCFKDKGLVCRYGGEEFAVILRDTDKIAAARLAEAARLAILQEPFDLKDVPDTDVDELDVTISVGVAAVTHEEIDAFNEASQLVNAADRAVYAAKKAGRNCVRIFKVRKRKAA